MEKEKKLNNLWVKMKEKKIIITITIIILVVAFVFIGLIVLVFNKTEIIKIPVNQVCGENFTDSRDGNIYSTIEIGNLCWMKDNLAYLPEVHKRNNTSATEPRYYVYGYDETNKVVAKEQDNYRIYGVLYNFSAAKESCPFGWRLASDKDFRNLELSIEMKEGSVNHQGWRGDNEGSQLAGNKELWKDGNLKNEDSFGNSGFEVFPSGIIISGGFDALGEQAYFWTSRDENESVRRRFFHFDLTKINRNVVTNEEAGFSVRCVKE